MSRQQLEQDLQDLLEGNLSSDRLGLLQERLRDDPDARELYLDYAELHSDLGFRGSGVDMMRVVSMEAVVQRSRKKFFQRALIGAAAAVALMMAIAAFVISQSPTPALTFEVAPDTEFEISHLAIDGDKPEGQVMQPGSRLELHKGIIELDFASGVRAIVRSPAEMILKQEDLLEVAHGVVWVEVPAKAVGFKVHTPDFKLTDLGTEFGVISEPNFNDEVHVFVGKVEVEHRLGGDQKLVITGGEARFVDMRGNWEPTDLRSDRFLDELPTEALESRIIRNEQFSLEQMAYEDGVSGSDLLHGLVPVAAGWNTENNASPLELNDGIHGLGYDAVEGDLVQGAWTKVGASVTYDLGKGPHGGGWDISAIQSIASWRNAGFGNQSWTVEIKPVGGSFQILETVNYHPLVVDGIDGGGATKVVISDRSGVLAKGIESIRFTAGHVAGSVNHAFVWREIDVFGRAVNE